MINEIPEEMMPEMFVVPITVPPVTYAKVIIQGDNVTIEPRLKTNADRIRMMTNEELAKVLRHPCDIVDHVPTEWCKERNCGYRCNLDWRKQECSP